MVKQNRDREVKEQRAADDADLPALDEAGGITREEQLPERGGEAGGGRDVERHDRTRDRELKE